MFNHNQYEQLVFNPPLSGMNQNISDEKLPPNFCYYMQNMVPNPLGEARVRYGTEEIYSQGDPNYQYIRGFPFQLPNGKNQIIRYGSVLKPAADISEARLINSRTIQVTGVNAGSVAVFEKDTYISLRYQTEAGLSSVSYYLVKSITQVEAGKINIEIDKNTIPTLYFLEQEFSSDARDIPFQFFHSDGFEVLICYMKNTTEEQAESLRVSRFPAGNSIKFTLNGQEFIYTIISSFSAFSLNEGQIFLVLNEAPPAFTSQYTVNVYYQNVTTLGNLSYSDGVIDVYDFSTEAVLSGDNQTLSGLSVACVPRSEYIDGKQWICNGVDPIMTWDGTRLAVYEEYVKEAGQSFARLAARQFSFTANSAFNIAKYPVGGGIQLTNVTTANAFVLDTKVSAITKNNDIVTITTTDDIPAFGSNPRITLFYLDKPPAFSYLRAIDDRIFALGPGAVGIDYRDPQEAMKVYYTYTNSNDFNSGLKFFKESTKTVPSLDIGGFHGVADNLEAIIPFAGRRIGFMGRKKTQVWTLNNTDGSAPDFLKFNLQRDVGVVHGDLIVDLPDDIYFVSQNGILSFSTLNTVSEQVSTVSHNPVDPLVRQHISTVLASNVNYRACRSFRYNSGGFAGFKIGFNDIIVSMFNTQLFAWGVFSGDFSHSSEFMSNLDDALYLFIEDTIYRYADGKYSLPLYADNGGQDSIDFNITWVKKSPVGWANKRYLVNADYSSSLSVNPQNKMAIAIRGDTRKTFTLEKPSQFVRRGDALNTIGLAPTPESVGFRLDEPYSFINDRLTFVSTKFYLTLKGSVLDGPLSFKEVRLFGAKER
jgi:hypothetical protein